MKKQIRLQLTWGLFLGALSFGVHGQVQVGGDINGRWYHDHLGAGVSLSADGSVVAIGAPGSHLTGDPKGYVQVYEKVEDAQDGFKWVQIGGDIVGENDGDGSGHNVSLSADGSVLAIGAYSNGGNGTKSGQVRVYERDATSTDAPVGWKQVGEDIYGEAYDESGRGLSLSPGGRVLAIGAPWNSGNGNLSGCVRVYERDATSTDAPVGWKQVGEDIYGELAGDQLGHSVSLSYEGSVLAIGTPWKDGNGENSGQVRVYERDDNLDLGWKPVGKNIDGETKAEDIDTKAVGDQLGHSVSLSFDGRVLAIGAPQYTLTTSDQRRGYVRVYERDDNNLDLGWRQVGKDILGEAKGDYWGVSVSLSSGGRVLAIGGWYHDVHGYHDNTVGAEGHVRVYERDANLDLGWRQVGEDIDGEAALDGFGHRVSLSSDGSSLAIGTWGRDANGRRNSGYVQVYRTGASVSIEAPMQVKTMASFEVTFTFDMAVTGFELGDIQVTNATVDNFTTVDDSTYTATIASTSPCDNIVINVPAGSVLDALNMPNLAAQEVIVVTEDDPPVAKAKDITVALGANGQVIINADQINDGSTDNCRVAAMFIRGNRVISSEGIFGIELVVQDASGNHSSAFAQVTVEAPPTVSIGNAPPVVKGLEPFTVEIVFSKAVTGFELADIQVTHATVSTLTGSGSTYTATLEPISACDGITIDIPASVATVANSSLNLPNLAATQLSVGTEDTIDPTITCPADVVANMAGNGTDDCTTTVALGSPVTDDNCSVATVVAQVDGTEIDPSTYAFGTGTTTVTWIVSDGTGNTASCEQTVTVEERLDNLVAMAKDLTVQLDASGQVTITPGQVDDGSTYGCGNTPELGLDRDTFTCDDVGTPVTVTLTATQGDKTSTTTATVTVEAAGNCESATVAFTIEAIADVTLPENTAYKSVKPVLSGNAKAPVTWTLGGVDEKAFSIDGSSGVVTMIARDYEAPADANADNVYQVSITATDSELNSSETSWTVTVLEDALETPSSPTIPTAFTPNGDGANDTWIIDDLSEDATVRIYDRHGTTIFSSDVGYTRPWDGTSRGSSLPAGSYLYSIQDGSNTYKGAVTILL